MSAASEAGVAEDLEASAAPENDEEEGEIEEEERIRLGDGHPDVGRRERRRVVDAVADHGDDQPSLPQLLDGLRLSPRVAPRRGPRPWVIPKPRRCPRRPRWCLPTAEGPCNHEPSERGPRARPSA